MVKWLVLAMGLGVGAFSGAKAPQRSSSKVEVVENIGPRSCTKQRVDACGCHHVDGVRHCHPNRRTSKCEALAASAP